MLPTRIWGLEIVHQPHSFGLREPRLAAARLLVARVRFSADDRRHDEPSSPRDNCSSAARAFAWLWAVVLLVTSAWNAAKLPFYMSSWSKDVVAASNITFTAGAAAHGCTDTASIATYWCHGLESSIQLGYWIGYRGTALAMPTVFLSFHTVAGVTVLSMAAWAVVSANARNRLAVPFFAINIIFAIQLLPACLAMQLLWKRILFTIACLASGIFGALGMATKLASGQQLERAFTRMPLVVTSREGAVWACWVVCMISAFGGAVLETLSVLTRYSIKRSSGDGVWPNLNAKANAPDDQTGHTPYDVPGFDLAFFVLTFTFMIYVWGGGLLSMFCETPVRIKFSTSALGAPLSVGTAIVAATLALKPQELLWPADSITCRAAPAAWAPWLARMAVVHTILPMLTAAHVLFRAKRAMPSFPAGYAAAYCIITTLSHGGMIAAALRGADPCGYGLAISMLPDTARFISMILTVGRALSLLGMARAVYVVSQDDAAIAQMHEMAPWPLLAALVLILAVAGYLYLPIAAAVEFAAGLQLILQGGAHLLANASARTAASLLLATAALAVEAGNWITTTMCPASDELCSLMPYTSFGALHKCGCWIIAFTALNAALLTSQWVNSEGGATVADSFHSIPKTMPHYQRQLDDEEEKRIKASATRGV